MMFDGFRNVSNEFNRVAELIYDRIPGNGFLQIECFQITLQS